MLKGFLNHGSVIVHDLLLGTSTRVHTVSFPARRARSRRSAGHTTVCVLQTILERYNVTAFNLERSLYRVASRFRYKCMIGILKNSYFSCQ